VIAAIGSAAACSSRHHLGLRTSGSVFPPVATEVYSAYKPCFAETPNGKRAQFTLLAGARRVAAEGAPCCQFGDDGGARPLGTGETVHHSLTSASHVASAQLRSTLHIQAAMAILWFTSSLGATLKMPALTNFCAPGFTLPRNVGGLGKLR
jgi:hypothetical protein